MKKTKQNTKVETRQRGIRMPVDLDDWLVFKRLHPNESFTSTVTRIFLELRAAENKVKK